MLNLTSKFNLSNFRPSKKLLFTYFSFFSLLFFTQLCIQNEIYSCTAFSLTGADKKFIIMGKNYDWFVRDALIYVNKRNVQKKALVDINLEDHPLEWISKYGSVTFNQHGFGFPVGGMNEKGLTVETLVLHSTIYPKYESQSKVIGELQWNQYVLDSFETVDELIKNIDKIRINPLIAKVHYMVCDSNGYCGTFEYLKGKLVKKYFEIDQAKVLTNHSYEDASKYAASSDPDSVLDINGEPLKNKWYSLDRFKNTSEYINELRWNDFISDAFDVLSNATVNLFDRDWGFSFTQWSIVYDIKNKKINYIDKKHSRIKKIDVNDFDYSCSEPVEYAHMNTNTDPYFKYYSRLANNWLVDKMYAAHIVIGLKPIKWMSSIKKYPASESCLDR
ncbi:MAG: linear amide C-N hydrolase [Oligoflexia bacterium]|nr:linear amide C-N hydrolase [Oligoflexia bacterium]